MGEAQPGHEARSGGPRRLVYSRSMVPCTLSNRHASSWPRRDCVRLMTEFPRRGWRAERRKLVVRDPKIARAPRGAPLRWLAVAGPAFAAPCPAARPGPSQTGQTAFGIGRRVVSQLLAGPRSGPGGSPAPPRVTCVRSKPRGDTAPRPASRRLMMRPLRGRGGSIVSEVCRPGITDRVSTDFFDNSQRFAGQILTVLRMLVWHRTCRAPSARAGQAPLIGGHAT